MEQNNQYTANILLISVGGVITQFLEKSESGISSLVNADIDKLRKKIVGSDDNHIELYESNTKALIRINFEELEGDSIGLEERDSAQVNPKIWGSIVSKIQKSKEYNGFVVLHGLDTLAYTASAVSFMIRNPQFPIVFTGSQRGLNFVRSDAPQNIFNSITIAAGKALGLLPIHEVTIFLHDTLYRGNRTSMSSATSYKAFTSLNYPPLASVGEHIDIATHLINKTNNPSTSYYEYTGAKVEIIDVFPGMTAGVIEGLIDDDSDIIFLERLKKYANDFENQSIDEGEPNIEISKVSSFIDDMIKNISKQDQFSRLINILPKEVKTKAKDIIDVLENKINTKKKKVIGVILRTYGMGTAPTSPEVLSALNKLYESGVFIQNVTQAHSSRVSFNADPVSLRLYENGIISGLDMTAESAFSKMVTVLSNERNILKGRDFCENKLQENIAGEQSQSIKSFHFEKGEITESDLIRGSFFFKKLIPTSSENDFEFQEIEKIKNIQLRILGLKKESKGIEIILRFFKSDEDLKEFNPSKSIEIINRKRVPWNNKNGSVNESFDVTKNKNKIFGKDSYFYISSDNYFSWKKISLQIYYK